MAVTQEQFTVLRVTEEEVGGVSLLVKHPKFYGGRESIDNYADDLEHAWMQAIETVEDYLEDTEAFEAWAVEERQMMQAEYGDLWDTGSVDDSLYAHLL